MHFDSVKWFNLDVYFEETAILAAVLAVLTSLLHPSKLHRHTWEGVPRSLRNEKHCERHNGLRSQVCVHVAMAHMCARGDWVFHITNKKQLLKSTTLVSALCSPPDLWCQVVGNRPSWSRRHKEFPDVWCGVKCTNTVKVCNPSIYCSFQHLHIFSITSIYIFSITCIYFPSPEYIFHHPHIFSITCIHFPSPAHIFHLQHIFSITSIVSITYIYFTSPA